MMSNECNLVIVFGFVSGVCTDDVCVCVVLTDEFVSFFVISPV